MVKVAFQDIDTDAFRVVNIDNLNIEVNLCNDEDFLLPLDFDRPIVINELLKNEHLITLARYYTLIMEESVSIISSDSFSDEDVEGIDSSHAKFYQTLNEVIVAINDGKYSNIEELQEWERITRDNGCEDWLFTED